jgi:putative membrane protein
MEHAIINSLVFSGIGIFVLVVAIYVVDKMNSRWELWSEIIERQNVALAILLGFFSLSIGVIIAAAVHG